MKKYSLILALAILSASSLSLSAQKYFTRAGNITFHSDATVEKIEAQNASATSVLDTETQRLEFAVLIKGFQFEKALMQEHFNENYMESDQFPKATFKGGISKDSKINWKSNGTYKVAISGELTIHGQTKTLSTPATFVIKDGAINGKASFVVAVADYGIEIPALVRDNIAKEITIDVNADYQVFNK